MTTTTTPEGTSSTSPERIFFESPEGDLYEVELNLSDYQFLAAEAKAEGVTFEEHLLSVLRKTFFPDKGETEDSGA